jgi:glyoxylase-like metal-dependent hydrolase (beta-lactamase superfamily II)
MVHVVPDCGFAKSYIVSGNSGLMVVDVGSIGTADDVADYIENHSGMSLDMVKYITATHFHIDHIGGIGPFLARCPATTEVLFHKMVGGYLKRENSLSLINEWRVGFLPSMILSLRYVKKTSHFRVAGYAGIPLPGLRNMVNVPYDRNRISYFGETDRQISESDDSPNVENLVLPQGLKRYPLGFDQWEIIETPGHTEDSICFFDAESKGLICGDLIVNMEKNGSGKLNRFCWDKSAQVDSYNSLFASIEAKCIYPGHGEAIVDNNNALPNVKAFNA